MKCKDPKHPQPPESPAVRWQFSFTRVPGLHHGFYAGSTSATGSCTGSCRSRATGGSSPMAIRVD